MTKIYDAVVIGAGHNGLVTAAYLAKSGLSTLAATESIFEGFRFDTGAHRIGSLHPSLMNDLELGRHGVEILHLDPPVFAPLADRRRLLLWRDPQRTAESIREISKADADLWVPFTQLVAQAAGLLEAAYATTPPNVVTGGARDLWTALKLAARLRRLGKKDMIEVLRILPMSVKELLDDWFESDALKGTRVHVPSPSRRRCEGRTQTDDPSAWRRRRPHHGVGRGSRGPRRRDQDQQRDRPCPRGRREGNRRRARNR
jgi:phytoene dehydrogenase-like protein